MFRITPTLTLKLAALFGFLSVALGAFAAHGLKGSIEANMLEAFKTGVTYQMFHALTLLLLVPLLWRRSESRSLQLAIIAFVAGIILFSGSLYVMAITGIRWLGIITPIGGVSFLFAWGALFLSARTLAQSK